MNTYFKWFQSPGGRAVVGLLFLVGFVSFVLRVIDKVRSVHGLDYYFTGEGVQFNYIGALILIVLLPVVAVVAFAIRYWSLRDERGFKKRYGIRDSEQDHD